MLCLILQICKIFKSVLELVCKGKKTRNWEFRPPVQLAHAQEKN